MRVFAATVAICLGAVFALNAVTASPEIRLRNATERAAQEQRPGDVVVSMAEIDQRAWLRGRIMSAASCPEILILGSSTSGMLTASALGFDPEQPFLNAWLSGPTPEDYEAIFVMLRGRGCHPRAVLLGVDHFLANPLYTSARWMTLAEEQAQYASRPLFTFFNRARRSVATIKERLSYGAFVASLDRLAHPDPNAESTPTLERDAGERACAVARVQPTLRHFDGHFTWCDRLRLKPSEVDALAETYLERDFHSTRSWPRIDTDRLARVVAVLVAYRRAGSDVVVFVPPLHPRTLGALTDNSPTRSLLAELDQILTAASERIGVQLLNFRNPGDLGCAGTDFEDSHHMGLECAGRLGRRLGAELGR